MNEITFLGMTGLLQDPVIRKMVAANLLTDDKKQNDLLGVALMAKQPEFTTSVFKRSI